MTNSDEKAYQIETALLDQVNAKCAGIYPEEVPDLIADRLFERLSLLKTEPARVLDLGTGNARHLQQLRERYPRATVIGADISVAMLQSAPRSRFWQRKPALVCLDAAQPLPFSDGSFDLVVSNLMLPWIHPPDDLIAEINRILTAQGVLFMSSCGPDTLVELRQAWGQIDDFEHVNAMLDMHDVGDVLLRSGIADPVVDAERLQVTYPSVHRMLEELSNSGAINVLEGRRRGLMSARVRDRLAQHYPQVEGDVISATLEVVYAHGWKGSAPRAAASNEYFISVESLKNTDKTIS